MSKGKWKRFYREIIGWRVVVRVDEIGVMVMEKR